MSGVFTANLPNTERRNALRFTFNPRFGDLSKYDHLRFPVGLRYGLTERWEVVGDVTGYVSHGLSGTAVGTELGLAEMHVGTKYNLGERILAGLLWRPRQSALRTHRRTRARHAVHDLLPLSR
jgi:hypothetical protein